MKSKKGISLIVLIVTIIVIIILASVVILTLTKNNPIESAKEAAFKSDISNIQDDLSMYISKQSTDNNGNYDPTTLNLSGDDMVSKLPSTKKYANELSLVSGKLAFSSTNKSEITYFKETLKDNGIVIVPVPDSWKTTIASVTEENVPIPKGFTYVEGTKNTGVVIQDSIGNQFVWVPVDGTNVKYQKDFSFPSEYGATADNTSDDTLPSGVSDETSDVTKYGGFYIGRYEAGVPDNQTTIDGNSASTSNVTGIPTIKKGKVSWTCITYINSKPNAESMYNTSTSVKSGLLTGKAWDTTCNWLKSTGVDILDSTSYGNYKISTFTYTSLDGTNATKAVNTGYKIPTGSTEYTKVNNIYDLAGNVDEFTAEVDSSKVDYYYDVVRGGYYDGNVVDFRPVSHRIGNFVDSYSVSSGFRVRLYIL